MTMFEVCIEDVAGLNACLSANVDRIELCSALSVGGLTPSAALINLAVNTLISVHVLIRPRTGHFYFTEHEVSLMCEDTTLAVEAGAAGVVLGAARQAGKLDVAALRRLSSAAGPASKTLHRVIDTMDNPLEAMEQAIDLGFDTILTSGGQSCVEDGMNVLARLNDHANGRIKVMAGAGLKPNMIAPLYQHTGITAFHSSCSQSQITDDKSKALGFSAADSRYTDITLIRQYQFALQTLNINE